MRFVWGVVALLLLAPAALAQDRGAMMRGQQPQVSPAIEATVLAYRQLGLALDNVQKDHTAEMQTVRQRAADMDAYLRACGDKPGCTVAAEK